MFKQTTQFFISIAIVFLSLVYAGDASADYYAQGVLESMNILSGADVSAITSLQVTATVPANTTVKIKFSQDRVNYYNAAGTQEGWDTCANGSTTVNLSGLGWTGGLLFYKLQLTTTDSAATPTVSEVQLNYTGTAVPAVSGTTYFGKGIIASANMLSGATVNTINSAIVTATVPSGTTAKIKFSQDQVHYYSSAGVEEGWDTLVSGINSVNLTGLGWSGGALYYKIQLESIIDVTQTATVSDVAIDYDGSPSVPPSGTIYFSQGTLVSTDVLSGSGATLDERGWFTYYISSLPYGSSVKAQFSTDGVNWRSSAGTAWDWDTLSVGSHLTQGTGLELPPATWTGMTSFYYKLQFTVSDNTFSPVVTDIGLILGSSVASTTIRSTGMPGSTNTLNGSQSEQMTNGLIGLWTFDGPDVNVLTNIVTDRSTGGHNGTITAATQTDGNSGQGLDFNGTTAHVSCGNVGSGIKTISFWMKADAVTNKKIMDFDGAKYIEINGTGHVVATGFPGATVYVDGASETALDTEWHHITVTDATGVNGSAVDIGRVSGGYFDGKLDEVRMYNTAFTAAQVGNLYRLGRVTIVR